jgi:hypothetical protein
LDGEQRYVTPKDKTREIQRDPIVAPSSCGREIHEIDGDRQQPKA